MTSYEKYQKWLSSHAVDESLKQELKEMTKEQIHEAFYKDLEFGTGGMRGIMGPGTNNMNTIVVQKATYGFGKYLLEKDALACQKGVVIAHDNRKNSDVFTMQAAKVLAALGIKTYIFDALRPTPELSFAVRYLKAAGGIMITASHNPKEYNGYKIYNEDGCQLILEQSNQVLEKINAIEDELNIPSVAQSPLISILSKDVDEAYYQMVLNTQIRKEIDHSSLKIVYSPQHGTGFIPVMEVLKRAKYQVYEVKEQSYPSPTFENTLSPNPEEKEAYTLAIELAKQKQADIVLTTDPDCDRVGMVVFDDKKQPVYFTGNQTGSLLMDYLLKSKKEKNLLVQPSIVYNTIVTSPLGAKVAHAYGVLCEQTLTGFKYIGDKIAQALKNNGPVFQMGYEESYGYLFNKEVRDKDGVQSVLLICEMAAYYKNIGKNLIEVFDALQQKLGYHVESQYSYKVSGSEGVKEIQQLMENLRKANYAIIANEKVVTVEDYLSLTAKTNDQVYPLHYEQSNVLRYLFEDGSFIAIRPSGTEPKCKFYFAFCGKTQKEAQERHDKMKEFILSEIKNGL